MANQPPPVGSTNYTEPPPKYSDQKPGDNYYGYQHGAPPGYGYQPPPGPGYQPPPAGYQPPPGPMPSYVQAQQPTTVVHQQVVVVGGCPACRVGVLEDDFTCLGVCCAILFFPLGILCCLAMRQRRCPNCGAIFG